MAKRKWNHVGVKGIGHKEGIGKGMFRESFSEEPSEVVKDVSHAKVQGENLLNREAQEINSP